MRTYDEAYAAALDRTPFSNGTEGYAWTGNWCDRCVHDKSARDPDGDGTGCPLVMVALMGRTPSEWSEANPLSLGDRYHCFEFRDEDDGPAEDPEPKPIPDPPDQLAFLPRPEPAVRMLKPQPELVPA